jgi:hypothetical protein
MPRKIVKGLHAQRQILGSIADDLKDARCRTFQLRLLLWVIGSIKESGVTTKRGISILAAFLPRIVLEYNHGNLRGGDGTSYFPAFHTVFPKSRLLIKLDRK